MRKTFLLFFTLIFVLISMSLVNAFFPSDPVMSVYCGSSGNCLDNFTADTDRGTGWSQTTSQPNPFSKFGINFSRQVNDSNSFLLNSSNNVMDTTDGVFCFGYLLNETLKGNDYILDIGAGGGGFDKDATIYWNGNNWSWKAEDDTGAVDIDVDTGITAGSSINGWHSFCYNWTSTVAQVNFNGEKYVHSGWTAGEAGPYAVDGGGVDIGGSPISNVTKAMYSDIVWWDKKDTANLNLVQGFTDNFIITKFRAYPESTNPFTATRVFHLNDSAEDSLGRQDGVTSGGAFELKDWTNGTGFTGDGVNDYFDTKWGNNPNFDNMSICKAFTIFLRIETTDTDSSDFIFSNWVSSGYFIQLDPTSTNNALRLGMGQNGGTQSGVSWSNARNTLATGKNQSLAIVKPAGCQVADQIRLYINGTNHTGLVVGSNNLLDDITFSDNLSFLADPDGTDAFNATIDDVLIFNRTLTSGEILTIHQGNYSLVQPDTTAPHTNNYNVTSGNILSSSNSTGWNLSQHINITSNLLTFTFDSSESANCSARIDLDQNYTTMVANNTNYKLATTETTSHSGTLYDNISIGNHSLYIACIDLSGNENISSTSGPLHFTRIKASEINITLLNPANESNFTVFETQSVIFNFTLIDLELAPSCDLRINGTVNQSVTSVSNDSIVTNFPLVDFAIGHYIWNINCSTFDSIGTQGVSQNRTFFVSQQPSVLNLTLLNPANQSNFLSTNLINFSFKAFDLREVPACSLRVNGTVNQTILNVNNDSLTSNFTAVAFPLGHYSWDVNCSTFDGGEGSSQSRFFDIVERNLTVTLCPNMSSLYFVPNISNYNFTTGTLTQHNVQAQNVTACGFVYNLSVDFNGTLQVKINNSLTANYSVEYNHTNVSTTFISIGNMTANIPFLFNVTLHYLNANKAPPFWNDTFRVID